MNNSQKKQFRPANLRTALAVTLVVIALGGGALFYWGLGIVKSFADEVNQASADANASALQIEKLQKLKVQLAGSSNLLEKANQLFATPDTYQSQLLNDVKNYADNAGLAITNTTFSDPNSTGTYSMTVSFKNPVSYNALITFFSNIESNLPKLQVSSLTLGHTEGGGADDVTVGDINIDISVR